MAAGCLSVGQAPRLPRPGRLRGATGTTPRAGRTRASTSPARRSASSAPGRPASRRSRRSRGRPTASTSSSGRRTTACPRGTGRSDPRELQERSSGLRRAPPACARVRAGVPIAAARAGRDGGDAGGAPAAVRGRVAARRHQRAVHRVHRLLHRPRGELPRRRSSRARKIREIVRDPAVAEALCPRQHIGTKRTCVDIGYFETYNRDNVELVDVRRSPIQAITPRGGDGRRTRSIEVDAHRLRDRLRRHDRRAAGDRHPRRGRDHAARQVGGRPAHAISGSPSPASRTCSSSRDPAAPRC